MSRAKSLEKLKKGLWNIYKPKGVSSFDVVRNIKRMTGEKKVGHAGTLDPLAEGVLIVGVGREATKQLRFVLEEDKEYIGEIKFGMVSETDDEEGQKTLTRKLQDARYNFQTNLKSQILNHKHTEEELGGGASEAGPLECAKQAKGPASGERIKEQNEKHGKPACRRGRGFASRRTEALEEGRERQNLEERGMRISTKNIWPTEKEIEKVLQTFIGDIIQISPAYSAIKIGGERAYKKARRGEKFTRPPRIVTIKEIEILDYQLKTFKEIKQKDKTGKDISIPAGEYPVLKIRTVVGSGTYIRSLAREIGEKLEVGGYLTSLVRTRIGKHKIEDSINLQK